MPPLRHDTLKPELTGVQEDQRAVLLVEVLVIPQAGSRTRQQTLKCGLSHHKWISAKIVAVKLDQIEGIQKYFSVMAAVSDAIEGRDPVSSARDRFAIDDAGSRAELYERFGNERKTISQIVAGAAVEPNPITFLPSDNPEAIVLNLK